MSLQKLSHIIEQLELPVRGKSCPISKITNTRQEILKEVIDEINKERIDTKYKPVSAKAIAIKLSHLKEEEIRYFVSVCKDYKNRKGSFSKCFFGSLKVVDKPY